MKLPSGATRRFLASIEKIQKTGTILPLGSNICAISSVGRAARLHREGREFKSLIAHQSINKARSQSERALLMESKLLCFNARRRHIFLPFLKKKDGQARVKNTYQN